MTLFSVRIASEGSPPERYTLQVPFQLAPMHALSPSEVGEQKFGRYNVEILDNQGIQLLRVADFPTLEDARKFFPRLRGALLHLAARKQLSILTTGSAMQQVRPEDPPTPVSTESMFAGMLNNKGWTHLDGFVDATPAVVIPEHLRILEFSPGSMSIQSRMPVPAFLQHLAESLALPKPERIAENHRLSLAIEMFVASLWETSQRVRVLTLATSLEALLKPEQIEGTQAKLIDQLLSVLDSERDTSDIDTKECRAFEQLRSRVGGLKEKSISDRLRNLAVAHANDIGEPPESVRRNVVKAYGVRSKLVHEGHAPKAEVTDAMHWLGQAVPAILSSLATVASHADATDRCSA